jgi:hypothetical protein
VAFIFGTLFILLLWHFWLVRQAGGLVQIGRNEQKSVERIPTVPNLIVLEAVVGLALVAFVVVLAITPHFFLTTLHTKIKSQTIMHSKKSALLSFVPLLLRHQVVKIERFLRTICYECDNEYILLDVSGLYGPFLRAQ